MGRKKRFFLFSLILIALILGATSVIAPFPPYHYYSLRNVCDTYTGTNSEALECCNNFDYCAAGANLADITVVSYLTEMGKYDATHSYAYCKQLYDLATNEKERAFAYGNCVHLLPDTISHNELVPRAIKYTLLPNLIAHSPAEYKFDRAFKTKEISLAMERSLQVANCDIKTDPNIQTQECKLVSMMQRAMIATTSYADNDVNAYELTDWYIKSVVTDREQNQGYSMGTGAYISALPLMYKIAFVIILLLFTLMFVQMVRLKKKGTFVKIIMGFTGFLWLFTLLGVLAIITNKVYLFFLLILYPISIVMPIGDTMLLDNKIQSLIHQFFQGGHNSVKSITEGFGSPTGFGANGGITAAQGPIEIIWIFIIIAIMSYFIFMTYKTFNLGQYIFKKKKKKTK